MPDLPRRYPLVRTVYKGRTPTVEVTYTEDAVPVVGCGETWCHGECGLPAIVIPAIVGKCHETKMRSDMVACGALMQPWRCEWRGTRVEVPSEHWDDFLKRMWL